MALKACTDLFNKIFKKQLLGEDDDDSDDDDGGEEEKKPQSKKLKPLPYKAKSGSVAQFRERLFKLVLILAIMAYLTYLAVNIIILFADQTNDPPLNTKIYAPHFGSGEPNFPAFVACHTLLAHKINVTQIAYSTRGNATSARACQEYTNGTAFCDADFPPEFIMWRVKVSDPAVQKELSKGRRNLDEVGAKQQVRRQLAAPSFSPAMSPTGQPAPGPGFPPGFPPGFYSYGGGSLGGYAAPPGVPIYNLYGPPVPPGTPTTPYDPYASAKPGETLAEEYEQHPDAVVIGVDCIAFNLTGVPGFTYKGHKPIRKEVTILFKVDDTQETEEPRIFDFGVDGLDMYYYSDPILMPGASWHLANKKYLTTFLALDDGTSGPEFVVSPAVFKTAYEDTNIVGVGLITQLSLSRIETTTLDDPNNAVISYAISAVSAQLDEAQVNAKFGPIKHGVNESHIGLVMVFVGPEITAYSFLAPAVGALLGQLGGLKGLLIDFWILSIVVVLYLDKILDPKEKFNVNKGKVQRPDGTIIVAKVVDDAA